MPCLVFWDGNCLFFVPISDTPGLRGLLLFPDTNNKKA